MNKFEQLATPGIRGLRPYQPGKPIDELERELGISNIIKLASNENPLGPSPAALAAVNEAAPDIWLYPDGGGFRLKEKLARLHNVDMAAITLGNGSSDLLEFVVRVFVQPGDEVLFSQHAFAIYPIVTRAVGGVPVEARAANWGYDLDALAAAITAKTKVIFIANPNNPTGTYVRGAALEAFLRAVPERIIVVVDEAYFDYASHEAVGAVDYPDTTRWVGRYPNLMVARTFSKSYGLAGLRVGYSVSHPDLANLMNRVRPPFNVNSLALVGAEAALDDREHMTRSVALNADGLCQLRAGFEAMGLEYIPSVGNFISVDVGRAAAPLYDALLREGVIVRPIANYGLPNHLRVTVGRPEENARFLTALAKVLG